MHECCAWCNHSMDGLEEYFYVAIRDKRDNIVGYSTVCYDCWDSWHW